MERALWAAAAFSIAVGAGLCWVDLESLSAASAEREKHMARYRDLARVAINLDLYRRQYREMEETFGVLFEMLPMEHRFARQEQAAAIEESIRDDAKRVGLKSVSVEVRPLDAGELVSTRRVDVAATGEFRKLLSFLQSVSLGSGRLWTIGYAALAPQADGRGLALLLELKAHAMADPEARRPGEPAR